MSFINTLIDIVHYLNLCTLCIPRLDDDYECECNVTNNYEQSPPPMKMNSSVINEYVPSKDFHIIDIY